MVQGQIKKQSPLVQKKKSKAARGIKIAPKNQKEATKRSLQKKLSSKTIVHTETLMAARAGATGKLTIMKNTADKALEKARAKAQ
ncbi:hypothetical protein EDD86DRAFT_212130 [Gorgonomyces haynaldii]|nr:hypothetical protein EDD86DRAFT_212130 [Gorgonomyces haynaldii]